MTQAAGKRDRKITILRGSKGKDTLNSDVVTWHPLASIWVDAMPVKDSERLRAGETLGQKSYWFKGLYTTEVSTVDNRDRVLFDGRLYDINGVKELGTREEIEITATARSEKS